MNQVGNLVLNSDKVIGFDIESLQYNHWTIKAVTSDDAFHLGLYNNEDRAKDVLNTIFENVGNNNYIGYQLPIK